MEKYEKQIDGFLLGLLVGGIVGIIVHDLVQKRNKMKKTAVEFKHTKVVSESGNELFFDEQGKFIKEEPKQETLKEKIEN